MKTIILSILCLFALSCSNDDDKNRPDCSLVDCQNAYIALNLIAQSDGKNLFTKRALDFDDLKLINGADGTEIPIFKVSGESIYIIPTIKSRGVKKFSYNLQDKGVSILTVSFKAKNIASSEDCCTHIDFQNVSFGDAAFKRLNERQSYEVTIGL